MLPLACIDRCEFLHASIASERLTDLIARSVRQVCPRSLLLLHVSCLFLRRRVFTERAVILSEPHVEPTSQIVVLHFRLSKAGRLWTSALGRRQCLQRQRKKNASLGDCGARQEVKSREKCGNTTKAKPRSPVAVVVATTATLPPQAAFFDFATWVAIASIRAGDRQS